MRSEDSSGCEVCSCNSTGTETPDQCDPLTGACYCKSGFSGRNICHPVFIVFVHNDLVALMNSYVKNVKRNGTIHSRLQL